VPGGTVEVRKRAAVERTSHRLPTNGAHTAEMSVYKVSGRRYDKQKKRGGSVRWSRGQRAVS
jgi:hypothetical protein